MLVGNGFGGIVLVWWPELAPGFLCVGGTRPRVPP